jgi:ketosteroid isomerase-like protein
MSKGRVEFAREGRDAWNRRDHGWMRDHATADFEFVPAIAAAVEGGSIKGIEAVIGFFEDLDESWETFEIEIDEFRLVGDQVAGKGRVVAKGRGSGVELNQPLSTLVSFDGEKLARMQSFLGHDAALEAAEQTVKREKGTA